MRPTITSNNFNLIAWNVLKQIKSLMIKYQTSWRRNYAHDLRVIDQELGRLEAWHIRVEARVELITIRTRDLLTVLPEDVLAPIVQLAAEAETPL
jgi:nucleoside-triphosphatase THEP1